MINIYTQHTDAKCKTLLLVWLVEKLNVIGERVSPRPLLRRLAGPGQAGRGFVRSAGYIKRASRDPVIVLGAFNNST